MQSITEKHYNEQSSIKSVTHFFRHYGLGRMIKKAGMYKQKGIPAITILQYLISLIYTGKSMYQDMRGATPFAQGFSKDTVYRFMNAAFINWQAFLLSVAARVVADIDSMTSDARACAFVLDDTMYQIPYAKKTELVSRVYDHAEKSRNKYKWGFRMLTMGWTDGVSFIPLTFRHLASAKKSNQRCGIKSDLNKRSRAYRIREEAVSKATDVLFLQLKAVIKAGIKARYVLFDSWFAYPATIIKIRELGLHITARVKDAATIKYLVDGQKKTAKEIFKENKKRRGNSKYMLSVQVALYTTEKGRQTTVPARLVFIRNRNKRNEWIALLSTDLVLSEEEVIALYGKRWDIEVFFKICKSYLKLTGEFRQQSYDALVAHTTIVIIRFMILLVEKRRREDPRSLGELFFICTDEVADIRFEQAILLLMTLLADTLKDAHFGLSEEQLSQFLERFLQKLPHNLRCCLQSGIAA